MTKYFYITALLFVSCTHKEVTIYRSETGDVLLNREVINSVIQKNKPIRLTYDDNRSSLKTSRGFIRIENDSIYVFEPRRVGETGAVESVRVSISQIKGIVVIENEAPQIKDAGAILMIVGIIVLTTMLVVSVALSPANYN